MPNTAVLAAGGALPTAKPTTFLPVTAALRSKLEATIENLIALADAIDGDADLEDDREADHSYREPAGATWLEAVSC
ncbi:hypothetical protein [Mesorhizobium sp. IMUNJ 23232]|uniref:hypothetical protein n=1 Tax=Mesorhizobium sp. IMUNJ 23232 TaxID=3376064 RepID=UPI00379F5792